MPERIMLGSGSGTTLGLNFFPVVNSLERALKPLFATSTERGQLWPQVAVYRNMVNAKK